MLLTLTSGDVVFERAKGIILKTGLELTSVECQCIDNAIADVPISEPGAYELWLSEIDVRLRGADARVRVNSLLLPFAISLSQADVDRGRKEVPVEDGVFRITVLDGKRAPVPRYSLQAWRQEEATQIERTITLSMDENGTCLVYGNPTQCMLLIEAGHGVLIERL